MKTSLKQQVFDLLASQGLGHAGQTAWAVCPLASPVAPLAEGSLGTACRGSPAAPPGAWGLVLAVPRVPGLPCGQLIP